MKLQVVEPRRLRPSGRPATETMVVTWQNGHDRAGLAAALAIATMTSAAAAARAQGRETGFLDRSVRVDGVEFRYQVYVPRAFAPSTTWPVILALHGGGEYGSDGLRQTGVGLAVAIRRFPERFPAIVVFPQAKADGTPGWQLAGGRAALAALDRRSPSSTATGRGST